MTHVPDRLVTEPSDRKATLIDIIRGARERIVLSLFRAKDQDVFDEIAAAVRRGVQVDVLVTSNAKGGRTKLAELWDRLKTTGARVHAYGDPVVKYHAKYLVADDGPAVVASLNFTKKCFAKSYDALVVTHDAGVVSSLQRMFASDRDGQPLPDGMSSRLIIGPERARQQFTDLIHGARRSVRIIDAKISDPDLLTVLRARAAAGTAVEVLKAKKICGLKSHGKIMLVDDELAVIGSLALTALSLEFRREVAIRVDDAASVAAIQALFSAARGAGADTAPSVA